MVWENRIIFHKNGDLQLSQLSQFEALDREGTRANVITVDANANAKDHLCGQIRVNICIQPVISGMVVIRACF
jgi:hypothetical protein